MMTLDFLGKKHGYVATGIFAVVLGTVIAYLKPDALTGFAAVLTAVNVPLYGGGAMAKWGDHRAPVTRQERLGEDLHDFGRAVPQAEGRGNGQT